MASTHTNTLLTAAQDRKARLAQLRSLKRKTPEDEADSTQPSADADTNDQSIAAKYLSGRNFDVASRNVRLGFEQDPSDAAGNTLEKQAAIIAEQTRKQTREQEAKANEPLDLFKLQPKKPNWDLKRELDTRMAVLNVRTENAIARLVRQRIEGQKMLQQTPTALQGADMLEAIHVMEREDAEMEKRDEQLMQET